MCPVAACNKCSRILVFITLDYSTVYCLRTLFRREDRAPAEGRHALRSALPALERDGLKLDAHGTRLECAGNPAFEHRNHKGRLLGWRTRTRNYRRLGRLQPLRDSRRLHPRRHRSAPVSGEVLITLHCNASLSRLLNICAEISCAHS